ncbi:putative anthranilate synthase [Helianthus anomalus]
MFVFRRFFCQTLEIRVFLNPPTVVASIIRPKLAPDSVELSTQQFGTPLTQSSMTSDEYKSTVLQAKEHIIAGDIFQILLSQRFERRTFADPFEIYRALRVVNPSPYMTYLQARVCILVGSRPEILTRVKSVIVLSNCWFLNM